MTTREFVERTQVNVSVDEFASIHDVYMHSDLDKDEFCKMWCKMNQSRVKKAIQAKKEAARFDEIKADVFEVYSAINGISWSDATKKAADFLNINQQVKLEDAKIEFADKLVYQVAYECAKFLNIA